MSRAPWLTLLLAAKLEEDKAQAETDDAASIDKLVDNLIAYIAVTEAIKKIDVSDAVEFSCLKTFKDQFRVGSHRRIM